MNLCIQCKKYEVVEIGEIKEKDRYYESIQTAWPDAFLAGMRYAKTLKRASK